MERNTLLYDFSDGVFFVSLASLSDPALAPAAIAEVVGARETPGKDLWESLIESLRTKQLLLVLDNFEHLLDACDVVSSLLDGCRELHVLVTSRIPLRLRREHEHAVPPLEVPNLTDLPDLATLSQHESVALFLERARAAKDNFTVTDDNAAAVAEICVKLDGLPLAIELAAARVKLFPPPALLHRLSSRLTLLTGGARDLPERQRTLRGAIDWSYSLLTEEEQTLFSRLAVFAGGCTFEAAEEVCNPEGDLNLLDGMGSLVEKSLLRQEGEEEPRFSMLQTIREYASEKLAQRGEDESVCRGHAEHFLTLALEANTSLWGPHQRDWLCLLERDLDNLRTALSYFLDHGRAEDELRLTSCMFRFWMVRGHWSEGRRWLEDGLRSGHEISLASRAEGLWTAGALAFRTGESQTAHDVLTEALSFFTSLNDGAGRAKTLNWLGNAACGQGDRGRAVPLYEESLALCRELGDRGGEATALHNLANVAGDEGNNAEAKHRFEEALTLFRSVGDTSGVEVTLNNLGWIAIQDGMLDEATDRFGEGLSCAEELGDASGAAFALGQLGVIATREGNFERAGQLLRQALVLAEKLGSTRGTLASLERMGKLALARGETERAGRLLVAAGSLRAALRLPLIPIEQVEYDQTVERVRDGLGEDRWGRVCTEATAMSREQAVADALGESV